MARYFLFLSYKGTDYCGWQVQPDCRSVQGTLEEAISTVLRKSVSVTGAGRTDTGVHASYYVAHFDFSETDLDREKFIFSLNGILPKDIAVSGIRRVKDDAHARFDAVSRTYRYFITNRKDPFNSNSATFVPGNPDIDAMNLAAGIMMEYTDFTSFSKLHTDVATNNCRIISSRWFLKDDLLIFEISADRFLRNMVRAIVGTMLDIGMGRKSPEHIRTVIEAHDRNAAGRSVPPQGLYLTGVEYPGDIFID